MPSIFFFVFFFLYVKGRNGKGSIYVFASGNGRMLFDNCASDGYVGNIHTVAISSVTMEGTAPEYAERCAAVIATAYSGGLDNGVKIVSAITTGTTSDTRHNII